MKPRMEIESTVEGNNMSITSASFLSAWVQSVQKAEHVSRRLSAGSIHSYCVPSSSTSIAQMEPYLPIRSGDEGIDGAQFARIKRCAVSFKCCWKKKKEMEVWLNYFYLKMFNQLYMSSSFIKHFHVFFFLQNSSFSFKDTDRKFPSNVDVSMFAGLWSLKIKSGGTGIWQ